MIVFDWQQEPIAAIRGKHLQAHQATANAVHLDPGPCYVSNSKHTKDTSAEDF